MRLPTSTIVMAVLVCVPFGFAIRDTLNHPATPEAEDLDTDDDDDAQAASNLAASEETQREARRQAELAEAQEAQEAQEARRTALGALLGAEPATLGPVFGQVELGTTDLHAFAGLLDRLRQDDTTRDYDVDPVGVSPLRGVEISASGTDRDAACRDLEARVTRGWGPGVEDPRLGGTQWTSAARGQRAMFDAAACTVTVERFAPVEAYVTRDRASVIPLWAIGVPVNTLEATVPDATVTDDTLSWLSVGVGTGFGPTLLRATIAGGKIRSLSASTGMTAGTVAQLVAQLTRLLGAPTDDGGRLVWKRKPGVVLDATDPADTVLTVGEPRN